MYLNSGSPENGNKKGTREWNFPTTGSQTKESTSSKCIQHTMLMDCGILWDDHHIELTVLHGAANRVQMDNRGELAAVLAQEQLHVCVVVVTKFLGLDGLMFRWMHRRTILVFLRRNHTGLCRVRCASGGGGGDIRIIGGWHWVCCQSAAACSLSSHRCQGKVKFCGFSVHDLDGMNCWGVSVI